MLEEKLSDEELIYKISEVCEIGKQLTQNEDYESLRGIVDELYSLLLEYSLHIAKEITDIEDKRLILKLQERYNLISGLAKKVVKAQNITGLTSAPKE